MIRFFLCLVLFAYPNILCAVDGTISVYIKEQLKMAQDNMEMLSETNMLNDGLFFFLYGYETACLDFIEEIEAMENCDK